MEKKKPAGYWIYEHCKEEADKYSSRGEFANNCQTAYAVSKKNGWLDEWFGFNEKNTSGYWTKERCYEEASKYATKSSFRDNAGGAYAAAKRNGWLKDYDWLKTEFRPRDRKEDGYWYVKDNIVNEAKNCKTISEFHKKHKRGYEIARINGWLQDCGFNEPDKLEKLKKYILTEEKCRERAAKYKSASEFRDKDDDAYRFSIQHGFIDYLGFKKGEPRSKMYVVYCYEDTLNKYAYAGLSNDMERRDKEHRNPKKNDSVYRHFKKFGIEIPHPIIVKSGLTKEEAKKEEKNLVNSILEKGWIKINIAKPGSTGGIILKWDYDACKELHKECKTWRDFFKASRPAYEISKEKGWIYEFYPDFKPKHFYTYEECKILASGCKSKTDLRRLCYGAYSKALKMGWLDDFDFISTSEALTSGLTKWYYDNCKEEAAKYKQVTDFQKGSKGAYMAAKKHGWLDDFFPETVHPFRKPHGYWTYEMCQKAASVYERKKDFEVCCNGAYSKAWRKGWLDDFFPRKSWIV